MYIFMYKMFSKLIYDRESEQRFVTDARPMKEIIKELNIENDLPARVLPANFRHMHGVYAQRALSMCGGVRLVNWRCAAMIIACCGRPAV